MCLHNPPPPLPITISRCTFGSNHSPESARQDVRMTHLGSALFLHSSLQNSWSLVRLFRDQHWTALFKSSCRFWTYWDLSFALVTPEHSPCCLWTFSVQPLLDAWGRCLDRKSIFSQVTVLLQTDWHDPPGFSHIYLLPCSTLPLESFQGCGWEASTKHDAATTSGEWHQISTRWQ